MLSFGLRKLASRINILNISPAQVRVEITNALQSNGIDPRQLQQSVVDSLTADVSKAMRAGEDLTPEGLANLAAFRQLNITPTRGQVTRDPFQYQQEQNMMPRAGAGELRDQYRNAHQGLVRNIEEVRAVTRGQTDTPYETGVSAITGLSAADERARSAVSAEYRRARQSSGRDDSINLTGLSQDYARVVEDFGEANIPGAIRSKLESYGVAGANPTKLFTMNDGEQMLQLISKHYDPSRRAEAAALDQLRGSIKNAIVATDATGGPFSAARAMAKQRFDKWDALPALKAVADGTIQPDDFMRHFVDGAKVGELAELKAFMSRIDPQSWANIRGLMVNRLKTASVKGDGADIAFSQDAYNRELNKVPLEKLKLLYSPEELQKLKLIGKVGRLVQAQPTGSRVNYSGTAIELLNSFTNMLGKIPVVGHIAGPLASKAAALATDPIAARLATSNIPISTGRDLLPAWVRQSATGGGAALPVAAGNSLLQPDEQTPQ